MQVWSQRAVHGRLGRWAPRQWGGAYPGEEEHSGISEVVLEENGINVGHKDHLISSGVRVEKKTGRGDSRFALGRQ